MADAALLRVFSVVRPFAGGGSSTPARRALLRPMALACFVDRAPCLPSRMWWISSRTNSPACVVGRLPSRLSCLARSIVAFSGMLHLLELHLAGRVQAASQRRRLSLLPDRLRRAPRA